MGSGKVLQIWLRNEEGLSFGQLVNLVHLWIYGMCFNIEDFNLNVSADIVKFLLFVDHFSPQHFYGKFLFYR